jgi:6-phosphofructokinase 1
MEFFGMPKRVLVVTGGGDCPGLNAVIRGIVKRASLEADWEVVGSVESYNGILRHPPELKKLDGRSVRGIHVLGGTILLTTNKGNPLRWPEVQPDGTYVEVDKTEEIMRRLQELGFEAVISIGGEGSQKISQELFARGCHIVGVPKTIDNDLSGTDFTFGFHTAVQTATEAVDRLVTTAESHNRVMIVEVMGRDAGWIAAYTAIAGGAEVCLIPEIPYRIDVVLKRIQQRFIDGKGYAIIVIAEGAKPVGGQVTMTADSRPEHHYVRLGGVAFQLSQQLREAGLKADVRETVLGHLLRGGSPVAFDRVLATQFGVKAFEMVLKGEFGRLVSYKCPHITSVPLSEAVAHYKVIAPDDPLVETARGLAISFGDE